MPKLYCRVNLRTDLEKRHRAGQLFTRNWRELDGVDDATLAALQEDPYLEVSDTPTVMVEMAAAIHPGAVETASNPNNPEESPTDKGPTGDAAQGSDTGSTASPATDEADSDLDDEIKPGGDAPAPDGSDAGADGSDAGADGAAAKDGEQPAEDPRMDAIKAAIAQLDPNNAEQWLSDGKPVIDAIAALTGFKVLAAERDQAWSQIKTQAAAE